MNTQQIICAVIVAILFLAIIIYKLKTTPTKSQKLEAKQFLDRISDSLLNVISNTMSKVDPNKYLNLELFLNDVYSTVYDEVWIEVEKQMNEIFKDNPNYKMIVKLIDRESVERLVDGIMNREGFENKLSVIFEETMKAKLDSMELEDKKAAQIAEAYENETIEAEEFVEEEPEEKVEVKEEEIPESVEYDIKNDDTVELLDEVKEDVTPDPIV